MLMSTADIFKIKRYLLSNGCILCEDTTYGDHPILGISNNKVRGLLEGMVSKGHVRKTFGWRHGYYFVKGEKEGEIRKEIFENEEEDVEPYRPSAVSGDE